MPSTLIAAYTAVSTYLATSAVAAFAARTLLTIGISKLVSNRAGNNAAGTSNSGARVQLPPDTSNKLPVVYGKAYIGGNVIDAKLSEDQKTMWYVLALAEHTDTTAGSSYSFGDIYLDGRLVEFDLVDETKVIKLITNSDPPQEDTKISGNYYIYLYNNGSSSGQNTAQTAIQVLQDSEIPVDARWTSTDTMTNCAFMIVKVIYDQNKNVTQIPQQIKVELTNSINSPGAVIKDYLLNERYGCGIPLANIDTASLTALDTYSQEQITYTPVGGGSATQDRYQINGPVNVGDNCLNNLQQLTDTCDSWLQYSEMTGQWRVVINQSYTDYTTFNDLYIVNSSNLIGGIDVNPIDLNGTYNSIEVQYPNYNINDQYDYRIIDLVDFEPGIISPNEPNNQLKIQYVQVNNYIQAAYLGLRRMLQSREDLIITFTTDYSGIQTEAGDVIRVTLAEYGWTDKLFRVSQVSEAKIEDGSLGARITAFEYNDTIYVDDPIQDFIPEANTGLQDPTIIGTPSAPIITNVITSAAIPSFDVETTVPSTGIVNSMEFWYDYAFANSTPSNYANFRLFDTQYFSTGPIFPANSNVSTTVTGLPTTDAGYAYYFATRAAGSMTKSSYSNIGSAQTWNPIITATVTGQNFQTQFLPSPVSVPLDANGTPIFANVVISLYGLSGASQVDFEPNVANLNNNEWTVNGALILSGISNVGNATLATGSSGDYAVFDVSNAVMTANVATITVPIEYKDNSGNTFISPPAIVNVNKQGTGTPGERGIVTLAYVPLANTVDPITANDAVLTTAFDTTTGYSGPITGDGAVFFNNYGGNAVSSSRRYDEANSVPKWTFVTLQVPGTVITNSSISTNQIIANTITANNIAANTITSSRIAAGTITANNIASNTITGNNIFANTITTNNIAANAITTDKLNALSVTTGKLAAGAVTAVKIQALTITANEIAANTITGNQIAANSISGAKITAGTLNADRITAGSITSNEIQANSVNADRIISGSITTSRLAANVIQAGYIGANAVTVGSIAANTITSDTIQANAITSNAIAAGAITTNKMTANSINGNVITVATLNGNTITANTLFGNAIIANTLSGNVIQANTLFGNRIIANTLLGDAIIANTLYGNSIIANTLNGNVIQANTLNGDKIIANTLYGNSIIANTINGNSIISNTISGNSIIANSFTANTINGNSIVAGSISGNSIVANTIDASRIQAFTLTSGQIQAGGIVAASIAANTITYENLVIGAVTQAKTNVSPPQIIPQPFFNFAPGAGQPWPDNTRCILPTGGVTVVPTTDPTSSANVEYVEGSRIMVGYTAKIWSDNPAQNLVEIWKSGAQTVWDRGFNTVRHTYNTSGNSSQSTYQYIFAYGYSPTGLDWVSKDGGNSWTEYNASPTTNTVTGGVTIAGSYSGGNLQIQTAIVGPLQDDETIGTNLIQYGYRYPYGNGGELLWEESGALGMRYRASSGGTVVTEYKNSFNSIEFAPATGGNGFPYVSSSGSTVSETIITGNSGDIFWRTQAGIEVDNSGALPWARESVPGLLKNMYASYSNRLQTSSQGYTAIVVGQTGSILRARRSKGTSLYSAQWSAKPVYVLGNTSNPVLTDLYGIAGDDTDGSTGTSVWVAVGQYGMIQVSTNDGQDWTQVVSPVASNLNSVRYCNGTWVIVGDFNVILTATNPLGTWTENFSYSSPDNPNLYTIDYSYEWDRINIGGDGVIVTANRSTLLFVAPSGPDFGPSETYDLTRLTFFGSNPDPFDNTAGNTAQQINNGTIVTGTVIDTSYVAGQETTYYLVVGNMGGNTVSAGQSFLQATEFKR
jgi:hypothetical protein